MKTRTIIAACIFDCEMRVGLDASLEAKEIREIRDESIAMKIDGKCQWVSISDFKNANNQTIGEYLLEEYNDFAYALLKEGDY